MSRRRVLALSGIVALTLGVGLLVARRPSRQQAPSLRFALDRVTEAKAAVDHVGQTALKVSDEEERALGASLVPELGIWRMPEGELAHARNWLQEVADRLARQGGLRRGSALVYHVDLVRHPSPNAFALPGGYLFVTTGMVELLANEAEAAALLGHEMAHVDLRHCIEHHQYGMQAAKVAGKAGEQLGQLGARLMLQGYQDDQEHEADRWGMILAAHAGYHPQAMARLFARMQEYPSRPPRTVPGEVIQGLNDAMEAYLASHPRMDARIQALDRAMAESGLDPSRQAYVVGRRNRLEWVCTTRAPYPEERVQGPLPAKPGLWQRS